MLHTSAMRGGNLSETHSGARQVAREIPFFNLDAVISVDCRVQNKVAPKFRNRATP